MRIRARIEILFFKKNLHSIIIIISLSLNMGPYLTVPRKDKDSVDGENARVTIASKGILLTLHCIDAIWSDWHARLEKHNGGFPHCLSRYWKWGQLLRSIRWTWRYGIIRCVNELTVGNEVAEFVRDHLIDELKALSSFKNGDYE